VQLDAAWVKRLAALFQLGAVVLWLLAATLAGVVLSVVFNTIRLQVINQSEEISVSRLLGATDAFVSRPFYYAGGLLGLAAGSLALAGSVWDIGITKHTDTRTSDLIRLGIPARTFERNDQCVTAGCLHDAGGNRRHALRQTGSARVGLSC
jgi:hypothetical protein